MSEKVVVDLSFFYHILIAYGALQALFLSAILLFQKGSKQTFFALFLLIEGFTLIERLIAETNLMIELPHLLGVSYPLSFLKPPILLFLTLAIVDPGFRLRRKHLLHILPFFLMLLMNLPFYGLSGREKVDQVATFIDYVPAYGSFNFWFFLSFFAYIGIYLVVSSQKLRQYGRHIKNNQLANWFRWVLYLYMGLLGIMLLHFLLRPSGFVEFPYINEASMLLMTFLIQSIAYSFLSQSALFHGQHQYLSSPDQLSVHGAQVKQKLHSEKLYLNDELKLEDFAASLGLPKKQVSAIINQHFGSTFKELVNGYRIEEAIRLMKSERHDQPQLTAIGLRSGFNNKVSFYRTFKKHTGKSPSDFYQSLMSK